VACHFGTAGEPTEQDLVVDTSMNRWLVSGVWLAALMAIVSASTQGAIGVAAMWALPAALAATMAGLGWPDKPMSRIIGGISIVWELALIGAYWPFASKDDGPSVAGPMIWPMHSLLILAVLAALALAFVAMFLLPALGLGKKVNQAIAAVKGPTNEMLDRVSAVLESDVSLLSLWKEYLAHLRDSNDPDNGDEGSSSVSARAVFDVGTVTHSRLRLELFRNLPGIFTGIGIIGTFSGLIMGLRTFKISQDPQVVQKSLELLMSGVWGAFLISAVAITLAIIVTLIEKVVMSLIVRRLDEFSSALDNVYAPRPQTETEDWMPRMIDALNALTMQNATRASAPVQAASVQASTAERIAETAAVSGTVMTPMSPMSPMSAMTPLVPASSMTMMSAHSSADANDSPERPATSDAAVAMLELGDQTQQAMAAMTDLARGLPATLAQHAQATSQTQLQSVQAMKTLSARLEGVASGIETSGRKTLETVAARMMQSEANMVSRHHAVAEHLGELVQRIEALCGLLQHDRVDESQNGLFGYESPGLDSSGFEQPSRYSEQRRPAAMYEPTPRSRGMSRQPKVEYEDGNEYDDGGYPSSRESDGRYDRNNDTGSFGS
jgi:hypothetical protein